MNQLTQRQSDALDAIKLYRERTGFPPTISELASLIGCSSPNAAADHVRALKKKRLYHRCPWRCAWHNRYRLRSGHRRGADHQSAA